MSTSMSYWPTELYQFDALNKLYGDAIADSPLKRAHSLHEINIKAGEEALMHQLSQQSQTHGNGTSAHGADGGHEAREASDAKGDGGGSRHRSSEKGSGKTQKRPQNDPGDSSVPDSSSSRMSSSSGTSDGRKNGKAPGSHSSNSTGPGFKEQPSPTPTPPPPPPPSLEYNRQQLDNLREASTDIRQNLLRLNVYLEDLSVVKFKQMPAYGMEDLFADIGGTLGLWMGVSVLTMMELLELIFRLSYLFMRAEWKPPGAASWNGGQRQNGARQREARDRSPYEDRQYAEHQRDNASRGDDSETEVEGHHDDHGGRGGYSYMSDADYRRSDTEHVQHDVSEANGGHSAGGFSHADVQPQPRTEYSGRTKYWRLKRGKSKR